jgi:hypothetical protein
MDTLITVAQAALAIIAGAVVALHVIAPMTKTSKDDTVLTWLQWVELQLRKLLPTPSVPVAKKELAVARDKAIEEAARKDLRDI